MLSCTVHVTCASSHACWHGLQSLGIPLGRRCVIPVWQPAQFLLPCWALSVGFDEGQTESWDRPGLGRENLELRLARSQQQGGLGSCFTVYTHLSPLPPQSLGQSWGIVNPACTGATVMRSPTVRHISWVSARMPQQHAGGSASTCPHPAAA